MQINTFKFYSTFKKKHFHSKYLIFSVAFVEYNDKKKLVLTEINLPLEKIALYLYITVINIIFNIG